VLQANPTPFDRVRSTPKLEQEAPTADSEHLVKLQAEEDIGKQRPPRPQALLLRQISRSPTAASLGVSFSGISQDGSNASNQSPKLVRSMSAPRQSPRDVMRRDLPFQPRPSFLSRQASGGTERRLLSSTSAQYAPPPPHPNGPVLLSGAGASYHAA